MLDMAWLMASLVADGGGLSYFLNTQRLNMQPAADMCLMSTGPCAP